MAEHQDEFTRRKFLKTAAAFTAGAALPAAHAAPAILTDPQPGAAVRYGMIGTGTEGCTLLKFLTTIPEGRCVATCDIYPPNLKKGVETTGVNPDTYTDYRQLLDLKDVDAILVCTPLYLHSQMVIDALDAGKHVFVEKTMYFKEEEGDQIRKVADAHPKQVLQVGLQRRSSVLYNVAMQMISKGALGKVMFVRAQWHRNSNWRRPVPDAKYERLINWRMYKDYSGGLMAELASHQIDVANWAFNAEPLSVVATGGIDYWKDGREVCDNVEAIYEYSEGRKLLYSSILYNAHLAYNEQILGDRGSLIITVGKGMYYREAAAKVVPAGAKGDWWAGATVAQSARQKGIPLFPETPSTGKEGMVDRELLYARRWLASMGIYEYEEPHEPRWSELRNLMLSIRDGKPVVVPLSLGMADAKGVIYGNRSIDTGQKVLWPVQAA